MKLWIVGKALSEDGKHWAFVGVFDTEQAATEACKDWRFWIGPVELNSKLPARDIVWPDSYSPNRVHSQEADEAIPVK